jgi:hypothetical protein
MGPYKDQGGPEGRSRRPLGRLSRAPAVLPRGWPLTSAGWRESQARGRGTRGSRPGRGGFGKGTLAAALIGQTRAGEKPAQSANKRTGRRPLSNPPLRQCGTNRQPPPLPGEHKSQPLLSRIV